MISFETEDVNVLNVHPDLFTSLEKLITHGKVERSITRPWPRLKVIEVWNKDTVRCIAEGVERGMFPSLTTVRAEEYLRLPIPLQFKLFRANISVERF